MNIPLYVYLCAWCLSACVACAQPTLAAKDVLEKLSTKYHTIPAFSLSFTYQIKEPESAPTQVTGKAFVQGNMYQLTLNKQRIYCNDTTMWTYLPAAREVTITAPSTDNYFDPKTLLQRYKQGHRYRVLRTEGQLYTIEITPFDKAQELFKIQLEIDIHTLYLVRGKLFYKDGSRHNYHIQDFREEQPQPATYFIFDTSTPKDLEVIDLR